MANERICAACGHGNPPQMPRCIQCGERAAGMMLLREETARPTQPWWSGGAGAIPTPPQVREEQERVEQKRLDDERKKAETRQRVEELRGQNAARDRERAQQRAAAAVAAAMQQRIAQKSVLECPRCATPFETPGGSGFSFCLRCGADVPVAGTSHKDAGNRYETVTTAQAVSHSATATTTTEATEQREGLAPGVAAVLSFFAPGVGQILNGQFTKGILLLLATYVMLFVVGWQWMGIPAIAVRVIAALDGYRVAERRRRGERVPDGEWDLT